MADLRQRLQETLAGTYRLERELGRGGMATVYLAHDLRHDRKVALKLLRPEVAAALGAQRFHQEIRTTARLRHPHILPLLDSGEAEGQLWYTMPFVEGETLRDRLRREGQLPLDDALRIAREVADALGYAHSAGVVHRDIKPENILLSRGHAHVADFGVSRALHLAAGEQLTETGLSLGTPAYMSPEQSLADPAVDGRSDLYSLGCVLYEMLAGETPYTGATAQAVIAKRLQEPVPHVRTLRETIPIHIDKALERALAKLPADRFATVEEFAAALSPDSSASIAHSGQPALDAARSRGVRWLGVGLALAGLTVASVVLWTGGNPRAWMREDHTDAASEAVERSVAVLPFQNLSASRENEYFSDGMTEELISALGKVEGLRVAARASSFAFKGKQQDIREVTRALGVGAVLDGSVRRAGNRLRVTAELVRGRDGSRLWADSYDRELRDVFEVQDEVASAIVEALRVPLKVETSASVPIVRRATADPQAHDLYLQARFLWNQRTLEALRSAENYFEAAIDRDSGYAEAWAGLADTYILLPQYGGLLPREGHRRAMQAAERALALDSTLPEAYATLGLARTLAYDWRGAQEAFDRGMALNPSYATAHQWYTAYLGAMGRHAEALREIQRARALDPLSRIIAANFGGQLAANGRYDDAVRELRGLLALDPNFAPGYVWLCAVYVMKGDSKSAVPVCERATALNDGRLGLGYLVSAYAGVGDRTKAMQLLQQLQSRARTRYESPWQFALAHVGLGNLDSCIAWLDSARRAQDPNLLVGLSGPLWRAVRPDPRFTQIRSSIGLPP